MYNQLFGVNPQAAMLFPLIGIYPDDVERFRDIYIKKTEDEGFFICVFTRIGGANRQHHELCIKGLQEHPLFDSEFDDDFDSTYATFVFCTLDEHQGVAKVLYEKSPELHEEPMKKFRRLLEKMKSGNDDDPEVKRAIELGKRVIAPIIEQALESGSGVVAIFDHDFKR